MFTFSDMRLRIFPCFLASLFFLQAGCSGLFNGRNFEKLADAIEENVVSEDEFLIKSLPNQLFDHTPEARKAWLSKAHEYLVDLRSIDTLKLDNSQLLRWSSLSEYLRITVKRDSFLFQQYPISHLYGLHLSTIRHFETLTVETDKQAEHYISTVNELETHFGGLIDGLEFRRKRGLIPPTFILKKIIRQCDSIATFELDSNPIRLDFTAKLNAAQSLSENEKLQYLEQVEASVKGSFIPSYKRLAAYLRQLERTSVSVAGVWQLPSGVEFYRYMLLLHTGITEDPSQVYQIGKNELAAIEGELKILNGIAQPDSMDFEYSDAENNGLDMRFPAFHTGLNLFKHYINLSSSESVNPIEKIRFLEHDRLATAKLLTDIGIHNKQWLRDQAVRFLEKHTHLTRYEAEFEVDQIIVCPGLATAEKVGFLKFRELAEVHSSSALLNCIEGLEPIQLNVLEDWMNRNDAAIL